MNDTVHLSLDKGKLEIIGDLLIDHRKKEIYRITPEQLSKIINLKK